MTGPKASWCRFGLYAAVITVTAAGKYNGSPVIIYSKVLRYIDLRPVESILVVPSPSRSLNPKRTLELYEQIDKQFGKYGEADAILLVENLLGTTYLKSTVLVGCERQALGMLFSLPLGSDSGHLQERRPMIGPDGWRPQDAGRSSKSRSGFGH